MRKLIFSMYALAGLAYAGQAQSQDELRKRFPNAEAVYTNLVCDVQIKQEEGKWLARSNYEEDMVYLTDNGVKMMSRGHIFHSFFNELKTWDAYLQTAQRKKLKVANTATTSSRQDYIFYDDSKSTTFDFAGASIDATRHMEYQIQHNDVHLLTPHYFDRYFPVVNGELRISFPATVKLKYIIKGMHADKVQFTETKKRDRTIYTFRMTDMDGVRPYDDAPDNAWYATHVIYYIDQMEEENTWKPFLSSAQDLYRHSYNYLKQVNKSAGPEIRSITDSLMKGVTDQKEKARRIYRWVQQHIKYVAFEDGLEGFIPRDPNLVCNRRFGDCKDMSSILTAMLNHAGLSAYYTWIGTRDIPYDYTEVPLPIVDNHMICTVKIGEEYIFLDGTDEGCIFGLPPSSIQDKQAMISISENEYKIIRVPVTPKTVNVLTDTSFLTVQDRELKGRIKVELKGYYASDFQTIYNFKNPTEREDYLKVRFTRGSNKIRFSDWKVEQDPDHRWAIITADFVLPDYIRKTGDEYYLNMNLFKWYEHQEIDFPKRKMPIANEFLKRSSYVTVIEVPEGFKPSYLPKGETYKNEVWGFVMNYSQDRNRIYLAQEFETDFLMYQYNQFENWNKVLEHLFPHYKQTVAFSKN